MPAPDRRPQVAVVANIYQRRLHTQHIIDRILDGYGWGGVHHDSPLDVVSLFVEQRGEGDLVPERTKRRPGTKVYPTVAQTLTRGTGRLAVGGVIYIGEQGAYPRNEKGQTEYPRYRFFEEIVEVFRSSGRSVLFTWITTSPSIGMRPRTCTTRRAGWASRLWADRARR
jgi:hypothetical protein